MQHFSDWQGAHSIDANNVVNKRIGVGERGGIQEGLWLRTFSPNVITVRAPE